MGAQYSSKRNIKLLCGYALVENPMDTSLITSIDGITPGGIPSVDYIQAQFSVPNVHRISGGVGMEIYLTSILMCSQVACFQRHKR